MKKTLLVLAVITLSVRAMAQPIAFPFKGGRDAMIQFFKDSLLVSDDIILKKATGTVVFKFTANTQGAISKIIVYYAEDAVLAPPVIEALKKSSRHWMIPVHEMTHDFIIPFSFGFNPPTSETAELHKIVYDNYRNRLPIAATDQVPLNDSTLLPIVQINYDIAP